MSITKFKMCWKYCSKMTVHTQDGIISFCLHRNNPVHEITRNAIIIELDTKWKPTEFLASSANCLPPPSQLSAPCFFEATYWTLVTDSDLKINKLKKHPAAKTSRNKKSSFALQHLDQTLDTKRILSYQAWTHNLRFLLQWLWHHLLRAAAQAAGFLP